MATMAKRSNEIVTLLVAILFFIVATTVSANTTLHGWIGLLFIPFYLLGALVVLVTSIIILVRDTYFRYKLWLLLSSFVFMFSAFLIVADNGDSSGCYYQGAVYGEKTGHELPFLPKYFSDVGFICFFVFGFLSMLLMVFFASSKKRI
jgi:hypothetical protein